MSSRRSEISAHILGRFDGELKADDALDGDGKDKTMAAVVFASALAMALIFMLYVLANFYSEAKRPRRRVPLRHKGVIAFRATWDQPSARIDGSRVHREVSSTGNVEIVKRDPSPVLPIGVRRLAIKRSARS